MQRCELSSCRDVAHYEFFNMHHKFKLINMCTTHMLYMKKLFERENWCKVIKNLNS